MFVFYRQLARKFKKVRKMLGIICVIYAKSLNGINYDHWTWMKFVRVITNNNTNLLCHLDNKHVGVASVKALASNKKKEGSVESGPETVHLIR